MVPREKAMLGLSQRLEGVFPFVLFSETESPIAQTGLELNVTENGLEPLVTQPPSPKC